MVKISFLGTGLMGIPMAQRLVDGNELMAYNRTDSKLTALSGAQIAQDLGVAIEHGDFIFLMLRGAVAINEVLKQHLNQLSGKTLVQMGNDRPRGKPRARKTSAASPQGQYLEAPVLGRYSRSDQRDIADYGWSH
jgi:3-hydroxyisobutyrate dehydrogenase